MHTIQQSWNPAELKGNMFDPSSAVQGLDRPAPMGQDAKLMNNLYSILTLSLFFYDRITKPFDGRREDGAVVFAQGSAFGS